LVQESAPVKGVEAGGTFSQGGLFVHAFCAERGQAEEDEAGVVEGLMGGDVEVIAPPERVWGDPGGYGAEVGHEAENALGLLVLQRDGIAVAVAIDLGHRLRGGGALSGGGAEEKLRGRVGEGRTGCGLCQRASRGEEQTEREECLQEGRPIRSGLRREYVYFRRWAGAQGSELPARRPAGIAAGVVLEDFMGG